MSEGRPEGVIGKSRRALLAVRGVTQVKLHPKGSKEERGNKGSHYQLHNFVVETEKTNETYLGFELTPYGHQRV